jgi:hypothetical protein
MDVRDVAFLEDRVLGTAICSLLEGLLEYCRTTQNV